MGSYPRDDSITRHSLRRPNTHGGTRVFRNVPSYTSELKDDDEV